MSDSVAATVDVRFHVRVDPGDPSGRKKMERLLAAWCHASQWPENSVYITRAESGVLYPPQGPGEMPAVEVNLSRV